MAAETEKIDHHCLLCSIKLGTPISKNSIDIFGEHAVTNSNKSLLIVIGSITSIDPNKDGLSSDRLCRKCVTVLNEADELETKLTKIKSHICDLFSKTIDKFTLDAPLLNNDDCNDHDYSDNIPSLNKVVNKPPNSSVKKVGRSKRTKKVTISKELVEIPNDAIILTEDPLKIRGLNDNGEQDQADNDSSQEEDTVCNLMENDSQIEEVLIEKKDSDKKTKTKKAEPIEEVLLKEGDNYTCVLCPEETREAVDAKNIVIHMKEVHNFRFYICDICGEQFKKRTDLSQHLDEHVAKEEGDFQCEVCNRIFNNLRLFRIHRRIHYPQIKSWSCETCGKKYSSKNLLDEHMNTHTGNRPYICEHCGKDFASKYTHRAHMKTHGARPRPYACTDCKKTFLSQQNLTQHMKTHNGVKEFICQSCGKAFGSAHNLEVHNIVHTGYKPYICRVCGKAFARKAEIRDHERTHTGEKPYQCEFCGATFSQRSNLQSHKRATHYNDKRYKCDDCGKGFKRRRLLDYHIKAAHTGERPYKCDTCAATFVYPEHFKKHMRIHTGEKPYLCEVCGKAFNSRDNRNAHRFIHSDKKPYECLVCGMGFMRKPLLYAHMQSQNHLNDTIVVNQPRLTTEEDSTEERVHLLMEGNANQLGDTQLIVAEFKDGVLIQGGDHPEVLSLDDENISNEDMEQLVGNSEMTFEESDVVECKTETEDDEAVEEVYGYQDSDGNTVILPPGTDISELINGANKDTQFVQIRIPAGSMGDNKNWLSLVQN